MENQMNYTELHKQHEKRSFKQFGFEPMTKEEENKHLLRSATFSLTSGALDNCPEIMSLITDDELINIGKIIMKATYINSLKREVA